jgi:RHS repeat-associated protein
MLSSTDTAGVVTNYTRDSQGRVTEITRRGRSLGFAYEGTSAKPSQLLGPDGAVLATYAYDGNGRLETVSYPDGTGYRYGYDGSSRIVWVQNAVGEPVESHEYDSQGRAITSEIGDGQDKLTFAYVGNLTTVTDARGNASVYEWTEVRKSYRVTKVTGPCSSCGGGGGDTQEWAYDGDGNLTSYKDGAGKTWTYTYSPEGDLLTSTDPLDRVTTYTYDNQGRVLTVSRPGGGETTTTWVAAGPATITEKVTATEDRTTAMEYGPHGRPTAITDPRNKTTILGYDPTTHDLLTVTDPLGHGTSFAYDERGRRTSVTDALNHTTTTQYDERGRVVRITSHDGTFTTFGYDKAGRRTTVTDPMGRTTTYGYDAYGRLKAVLDPANGATQYGYDVMGNLTSLTDANGNATAFAYDTHNRVQTVTYPGGASESFTYDTAGRLATKTDRKGIVTTYSYDDLGRLTGKTYSDGTTPPVSYTYDTAGRLQTAANGTDTLTWAYDLAGQLTSEQSARNASTVAYTYDAAGNRLTVSLDGTLFVSYAYDDASRLTTINRGTNVFGFGYDNANRRTSMTYPNGVTTSYSYDDLNRLLNLQANHVPTGTPITSFTYTYDPAGNRTTKTQLDYAESYSYDNLYRLTGVERTTGPNAGIQRFGYDPVGNRLTKQQDSSVATSTYNEKNQLTGSTGGGLMLWRGTLDEPGTVSFTSATVNGQPARMLPGNVFEAMLHMTPGSNTVTLEARDTSGNVATKSYSVDVTGDGVSYSYDPNGNLTQKVDGADAWTYEWNAENQLKRVTKNAAEVASFQYDPLGRRVEKVAGGTTSAYAYDGEDILRLTSGATVTKHVHGRGIDEPLASEDGSGVMTYLSADGLGSITATTNATGAVASATRYDAWGNAEAGAPSPYGFTGREHDSESAMAFYRARYYSPGDGRFLSEDPIGFHGGVNFYAYAANQPALRNDPTGLLSCVKWPDGNITCVQDPSLCLEMGWCTPWPPKCPSGFFYFGHWGGPGWTGAQCGSWNTIDHARAEPPKNPQDAAYCRHDRCYGDCATLPTGWQRFLCRAECDQGATRDLLKVVFTGGPDLYALGGIAVFSHYGGAITSAFSDESSPAKADGTCCTSRGGRN